MKKRIIIKILSLIFCCYCPLYLNNLFVENNKNNVICNNFFLSDYFKNINKGKDIFFNLTSVNYFVEPKMSIIKVEYFLNIYDIYENSILPSDFTLYHNFHIMCYINYIEQNNIIYSVANIHDKQYKCIEFINKHDKIIFGIVIYETEKYGENKTINLFSYKQYKFYKYFYKKNNKFYCLLIIDSYNNLKTKIINNTLIKNDLKLKQSYLLQPLCSCKNGEEINSNEWLFNNFFDNYFCFCKGPMCQFQQIPQTCKYFFYLNIIDNYKDYYNKTEYLLGDFIYNGYSSDDSYPVFQEMINQNISAHYMTQDIDIYNKYCNYSEKCLKIIKVNNDNEIINGDFLEKYLILFLKLKIVISGAEFFFIDNLFFNINYITYICLGHGVSFFKPFLYSNHSYYGNQIYNKILIPPAKKLISLVKSYGWKEEDIIKNNLPRWDKFNVQNEEQKNKSIFIMFTWRDLNKNQTISEHYLNNITSLINNYQLIQSLKKKKLLVILHFIIRFFKIKQLQN